LIFKKKRITLVLVPKKWNPMCQFYFGLEKIIIPVMVPIIKIKFDFGSM
jgi:hypothetical protein